MTCDTSYLYEDIFKECGARIRTILLDPTSLLTEPLPIANTYPIYESRDDYDNDTSNTFKGLLVWHTHQYYASISDNFVSSSDTPYSADAGFYVVPTFGNVIIRPNVEYKQLLTVVFDSNSDLDYDPFNLKITNVINTFVNNVNRSLEKYYDEMEVNGRQLYVSVVAISTPSPVKGTVFERRVVTIQLRYCHCY